MNTFTQTVARLHLHYFTSLKIISLLEFYTVLDEYSIVFLKSYGSV